MARGRLGAASACASPTTRGAGAALARSMQSDWAEQAINVELRPLHGGRFESEALSGWSQMLLVEAQARSRIPPPSWRPGDAAARAAVGTFRTGWRTREFDRWIAPRVMPPRAAGRPGEHPLEEECIVMPLARLPWSWIERDDAAPIRCDPRFGPQPDRPGVPRVRH